MDWVSVQFNSSDIYWALIKSLGAKNTRRNRYASAFKASQLKGITEIYEWNAQLSSICKISEKGWTGFDLCLLIKW